VATQPTLDALRRFHFGDPAVLSTLPAGVLPAALEPYRGKPVRSGWPLLVDLAASGENWLRPLAFAEGELQTGDGLDRPAGSALLEFDRRAPLALATLAARRRLTLARAAFAGEAHDLALAAEALLAADHARRPEGAAERARGGSMGALGTRFVDTAELAHVVGRRRAGAPFPEARRQRLEAARDRLRRFDSTAEPLWIVAHGERVDDLGAPARVAADPRDLCPMAAAAFDESTREVVELARAVRIVRLEAAEAFVPERHQAWIERLDWRGLAREELLLVPPVLVLFSASEPLVSALSSLSALLLSGRPVQIVVLSGEAPQRDALSYRLEPAYLGVAHREVFVQQGSLAYPLPLAAGLDRALGGSRAGLHVIDAPESRAAADTAGGELDAWLVASARVSGRAAPIFRFDPEAGSSWARRMHFDENPEPTADWPREPLWLAAASAGAPDAAFTFADAALLDPAWWPQFTSADAAVGAGAAHDSNSGPRSGSGDLLPLAQWLGLDGEAGVRHLPFVWASDASGARHRLVVSRALALATRDRLAYWRTLEELAGVRNEHVEAAIERVRDEASERAARVREELAASHAEELARERATADQRAVDGLVSILFELDASLEAGGLVSTSATPSTAPAGTGARIAAPTAPVPAAPAGASAASVADPAAPVAEEAWIDTALCTSCDECIRKAPGIFAYNENKQAFVKNPRGGSFRDLVAAAESCTAKIIHPGLPWNSAEPDLEGLRERARAFA